MFIKLRAIALAFLSMLLASLVFAEDEESNSERQIEDVVVYGDRVESTVSDTSISITAMSEEFLMDMGIHLDLRASERDLGTDTAAGRRRTPRVQVMFTGQFGTTMPHDRPSFVEGFPHFCPRLRFT